MADVTLNWKGDELKRTMEINGAKIISEFGLTVEAEAKKELRRGHGVETGTLRRSIHTALVGYDWSGDDVEPSQGAPELGGTAAMPDGGNQLTVQVGSGLVYAMAVHQGHHNFSGYHYLTNGLTKAKGKLASIMSRHKVTR